MNIRFLLIVCIICILIGARIGMILFHRPIIIEFKISPFQVFMFAFAIFFMTTVVMVLELLVNQCQLVYLNTSDWRLKVLSSVINGGLLIAIALPVMSVVFGKFAIACNLDLCNEYDINAIKLYYSLAIITNCAWFGILFASSIINGELEAQYVLNRIIIWILSVIGTWWGIGFRCEGRIYEEIKKIRKSKEKKTIKGILKYSIPFVIAFLANCFLLLVQTTSVEWVKNSFLIIYISIFCGCIGALLWIAVLICKERPSKERSNKKLVRAFRKVNIVNLAKGRYQTIQYSLVQENKEKYILIYEQPVIWIGHEEEVKEMFGEKKICLEMFDYRKCQRLLEQLGENRSNLIRDGYALCRAVVEEQLIEQTLS